MKKIIGVHPLDILDYPYRSKKECYIYQDQLQRSLKQNLLFFDKICFESSFYTAGFDGMMKGYVNPIIKSELEWLFDEDLLGDFTLNNDIIFSNASIEKLNQSTQVFIDNELMSNWNSKNYFGYMTEVNESKEPIYIHFRKKSDCLFYSEIRSFELLRNYCAQFYESIDLDAFPILSYEQFKNSLYSDNKSEVIHIIIKNLPLLDSTVSWETIIDFRKNDDFRVKFLSLKSWINRISRINLSKSEMQDEIEYLINDYRQQMKLSKMKTRIGQLESIVCLPLELLENLIKIKWSKIPKEFIQIRKRKIDLLAEELKSPGRELSYIVSAQDYF